MSNLTRYMIKRIAILSLTLVLAIYATVVIANMGGYVDKLLKDQIKFEIVQKLNRDPMFAVLSNEEKERLIAVQFNARIKAAGLDQPFPIRSMIQLTNALTLNLGRASFLKSASGSSMVSEIILERLPRTILLFTTGTVLASLLGLYLGLQQAKKALSKFDRSMILFSIFTYVQPAWFFGILFILLFSFYLRIFPPGGMVSAPPPADPLGYALDLLYHLALPLITWVFATFGYWSYTTRNIVLQTMSEDFVTAAKARGLPSNRVLFRYVLRPASPPIVTGMVFALVFSWTGAIITEAVFNWPGLGLLFLLAIEVLDAPVLIGLTVVLAYLIFLTVILLDIIYAILDPRIKISG
ncbi:MAG: ABC transporter permease [Aigarchaeota archaeon]|nr:ABC transporter permease [Candidatus Pelearchaeum maunauluense]